jgi:arsenate reductase (glutaredoxin)
VLKLNVSPSELIRTQEEVYKKELKGKSFTSEEWIRIISENPKLLQRPLILTRHKAVLGDPPENIDKLFNF